MRTTSSAIYLSPPDPGQRDAWTTETQGRGSQRIAAAGVVGSTPEIAQALDIPDGSPVAHRSRLMLLDGEPVELVVSYFPTSLDLPPDAAEALAAAKPVKGGTVRLLAEHGYRAARVVEEVSAEVADDDSVPGAPKGSALLVTRRTVYAAGGVPFEHTVMAAWDGRRQRYVMEIE
jgi:GntR family transcriptional regulator